MERRGSTAFSLFAILCIGGILTLFSQADAQRRPATLRSMNAASPDSGVIRRLVPAALEASVPAEGTRSKERDPSNRGEKQRLLLR